MLSHDYIRDGAAIYERSFAIIREEADLSRFTPEQAEVAVRMIHACGRVDAAAAIDVLAGPRDGARAARSARCADLLRCADGGARRDPRPAAGGQRCDLHLARRRACRRSRRNSAQRARRRRSNCGATGSEAPSSPSAMRRPRCSICSRCSRPARRNRPRSSAFRSASSARRNRRRRSPPIRMACRISSCAGAWAAAP